MLETLLGSKLRAKVLGWLFTHPDERYFVRQLTVLLNLDSANLSRELSRLGKMGLLVSTTSGIQKYYQANARCPIFNELRGIVVKTFGVADVALEPMDVVAQRFKISENLLTDYCRRHHIIRLALFGSVLREDFRPDSDVDILVEFEAGHVPGFAIIDMENELSRMVGRKVDLRTPGDLSRYFRDRVIREARVAYAEAGL
jgi:uncharacterized protein